MTVFSLLILQAFFSLMASLHLRKNQYTFFNLHFQPIREPNYDMYVLAVQWTSSTCKRAYLKKKFCPFSQLNILTLHGLWPNKKDGSTLECHTGDDLKVDFSHNKTLYRKMNKYWHSEKDDGNNTEYYNEIFWNHEYNKHGYCYTKLYGLNDTQFFSDALTFYKEKKLARLFQRLYKEEIHTKTEVSTTVGELRKKINSVLPGESFELRCSAQKKSEYYLLDEIYFYYNLTFAPYQRENKNTGCKSESDKIQIPFL